MVVVTGWLFALTLETFLAEPAGDYHVHSILLFVDILDIFQLQPDQTTYLQRIMSYKLCSNKCHVQDLNTKDTMYGKKR